MYRKKGDYSPLNFWLFPEILSRIFVDEATFLGHLCPRDDTEVSVVISRLHDLVHITGPERDHRTLVGGRAEADFSSLRNPSFYAGNVESQGTWVLTDRLFYKRM
jgi:hypothetical protein